VVGPEARDGESHVSDSELQCVMLVVHRDWSSDNLPLGYLPYFSRAKL